MRLLVSILAWLLRAVFASLSRSRKPCSSATARGLRRDDQALRFLIRDRNSDYGIEFQRRVKGFGTRRLVTPPRAPQANAFCERIIRTLRRDCLDNLIILDHVRAERILREYVRYYHGRPHRGLRRQAPAGVRWLPPMRPVPAKAVHSRPVLGGLHHEYAVAA